QPTSTNGGLTFSRRHRESVAWETVRTSATSRGHHSGSTGPMPLSLVSAVIVIGHLAGGRIDPEARVEGVLGSLAARDVGFDEGTEVLGTIRDDDVLDGVSRFLARPYCLPGRAIAVEPCARGRDPVT